MMTRLLLLSLTILAVGCSSSSTRDFTADDLAALRREAAIVRREQVVRVRETLARRLLAERAAGAAPRLDVLILSGGGSWGAFGAGALIGWSEVPADHPLAIPEFDIVTGVSTGALMAPYAIVGTREGYETIERVYRECKPDWAQLRSFAILPSREAFFDVREFHAQIDSQVDEPLMAALARAHDEHRQLLISTSDLDLACSRLWSGTELAEAGNREKLVKVIQATTSIPGIFPPVEIDGTLQADGGVIEQVFVGISPGEGLTMLREGRQDLPIVRFWVIVNNRVALEPALTERRWGDLLGRTMRIMIRSTLVAPLRELNLVCELARRRGVDAQLRILAVPFDTPVPEDEEVFDPRVTNQLADLGRKMGADPESWLRELPDLR